MAIGQYEPEGYKQFNNRQTDFPEYQSGNFLNEIGYAT